MQHVLAADWSNAVWELTEHAWLAQNDRPKNEVLRLQCGADGERLWSEWTQEDPQDAQFVLYFLGPVDPRSPEPARLVGRWSAVAESDMITRIRVILDRPTE